MYDRLENLSEIWYTESGTKTKAYSYEYTSDGKLHKSAFFQKTIDIKTKFVYNNEGKSVGHVRFITDKSFDEDSSENEVLTESRGRCEPGSQ